MLSLKKGCFNLQRIRKKQTTVAVLLLVVAITARAEDPPALPAFKKLQALVGGWEGTDERGMKVKTAFELAVANTTVVENLVLHGMEGMLTLYTVDGDGIALVHFCPTNNQPRMRAVPKSTAADELDFQFTGAGNLPELNIGHEQRLVLRFKDQNHITERWTWQSGGKDHIFVYEFARTK